MDLFGSMVRANPPLTSEDSLASVRSRNRPPHTGSAINAASRRAFHSFHVSGPAAASTVTLGQAAVTSITRVLGQYCTAAATRVPAPCAAAGWIWPRVTVIEVPPTAVTLTISSSRTTKSPTANRALPDAALAATGRLVAVALTPAVSFEPAWVSSQRADALTIATLTMSVFGLAGSRFSSHALADRSAMMPGLIALIAGRRGAR